MGTKPNSILNLSRQLCFFFKVAAVNFFAKNKKVWAKAISETKNYQSRVFGFFQLELKIVSVLVKITWK